MRGWKYRAGSWSFSTAIRPSFSRGRLSSSCKRHRHGNGRPGPNHSRHEIAPTTGRPRPPDWPTPRQQSGRNHPFHSADESRDVARRLPEPDGIPLFAGALLSADPHLPARVSPAENLRSTVMTAFSGIPAGRCPARDFWHERVHYWRLLVWTPLHRPRLVPLAVTRSIFGPHFFASPVGGCRSVSPARTALESSCQWGEYPMAPGLRVA